MSPLLRSWPQLESQCFIWSIGCSNSGVLAVATPCSARRIRHSGSPVSDFAHCSCGWGACCPHGHVKVSADQLFIETDEAFCLISSRERTFQTEQPCHFFGGHPRERTAEEYKGLVQIVAGRCTCARTRVCYSCRARDWGGPCTSSGRFESLATRPVARFWLPVWMVT